MLVDVLASWMKYVDQDLGEALAESRKHTHPIDVNPTRMQPQLFYVGTKLDQETCYRWWIGEG